MGRWVSDEQQGLIGISAVMVLMSFSPFLITGMRPFIFDHWLEGLYHIFLPAFIALHIWISTRGKRFGHIHIIPYVFSIGLLFCLIVLLVLNSVDRLYLEHDGEHAFTTLQWTGVTFYLLLVPVSFSLLFFLVAERDLKFKDGRIRLPVSRYHELNDEFKAWTRPGDIIEVYPRWTFTVKERGKGFRDPPVYGAKEKEGFGFRLKDGRRFGYEMTSRMILQEDLEEILGKERFRQLFKDHSELDDKDLRELKRDISHWYTNHESYQVIPVLIGLAVFFIQAAALTLLSDNINYWIPIFMVTSMIYFGPLPFVMGKGMKKWLFIKGTIFRMRDRDEVLPKWMDIKGLEFHLKK